jgi:LuxR family maltose regulon positive regulatory protein
MATHKLFAPPMAAGAILRQSVLERIFSTGGPHVILVQGPAGHGKSTLMQQAKSTCEASGTATGWLTFDEADNDISRFFTHLQSLLVSVEESSGSETPPSDVFTLKGGRAPRSDWVIDRLLALGTPVALFFDEFQTLHNKSILGFFRSLLERIPDNVMIFLGSRTVPEIGLARLVVNNQALVLRAQDLRFSLDEVSQFFAGAEDLQINREEVEAIHGRTEGWPAALQLYRLSLISPLVRQSLSDLGAFRPRELAEYLADNVLALQPEEVQAFLLQTSLLKRLCAPLCDAVLQRDDSQQTLQSLENSGLFLRSLDSGLYWFKYHTLFSSFLAEQLREQSPERVAEIHRRAADWYRNNGHFEEAIHHAIAIRDHSFAAAALDTWATQLIMDGDLMTVERWYDRLPLDQIERHPDLVVKIAYALSFLRRRQKLSPILQMLDRQAASSDAELSAKPAVVRSMSMIISDDIPGARAIIENVELRNLEAEGFRAFELGAGCNLEGYLGIAAGDFERARDYLSLARAHSDRAGAPFSLGYSLSTAGVNLMVQGLLQEALEKFRQGMSEPRIALDESVASAALVSCYVQALYEANDLKAAESLFMQFHDVIANAALLDYLTLANIAMSRIHDAQGHPAKAQEILDEVENIGHASSWPRVLRIISWERVRRALLAGDIDRAHSIASRIPQRESLLPEGWIPFSEDTEGDVIGEIRLAVHEGKSDDALARIGAVMPAAVEQGRVRRQIKLHILEAMAHRSQRADNVALRALLRALQLAVPGQFVRIFLEEGRAVIELLGLMYQSIAAGGQRVEDGSGITAFVEALLDASGTEHAVSELATGTAFQPLEALTEREKQILMLLANGVSNKQIAKKVFVSENTVKFHLKNVYSKLGVSSRIQAISAARQMGLI